MRCCAGIWSLSEGVSDDQQTPKHRPHHPPPTISSPSPKRKLVVYLHVYYPVFAHLFCGSTEACVKRYICQSVSLFFFSFSFFLPASFGRRVDYLPLRYEFSFVCWMEAVLFPCRRQAHCSENCLFPRLKHFVRLACCER